MRRRSANLRPFRAALVPGINQLFSPQGRRTRNGDGDSGKNRQGGGAEQGALTRGFVSAHDRGSFRSSERPFSWVYGKTRRRSFDRIPGFRLGKYWRFREADVLAWIERQRVG